MILTAIPATNVRTARRGDGGLHPGTASQLTIQAGSNQTAVAGSAVPIAPAVLVLDQLNRPVAQAPIQFVVAGGSTASEVTMDPFNRADQNPLAGNWTKAGGAATTLQLLSNAVQGVTAGGEGLMFYSAVTWPADQYAECQVSVASTVGGGPAVRVSGAAETAYIAQVHTNGTAISMAKFVAGVYTAFQNLTVAVASTDTIRLEVQGSTLRLFKNAVQVGPDVIDGSIVTGSAGMDYVSNTTGRIDNWAAGVPPSTSGTVNPSTTISTDPSGIAAATIWTLGVVPGVNTLTVTTAGLVGSPVSFTATGVSAAAQATQIAISAGNGQSAVVGATVAIPPSVIVRDASNNPVAGVLVTFAIASGGGSLTGASQTTNATGIATVGSWTLGAPAGANTITAASAGLTGSPLTFTATGTAVTATGTPDPTRLPVAAAQVPDVTAYAALNLPSRAAGYTYDDPLTAVRIWKATSATVPAANSGAGHDYGEGPTQASRGWGMNSLTHTILIRGAGMAYYLVDFTRGAGFTNYRVINGLSFRDLAFGFSNVAGQERIAYALSTTDGKLHRYDTAANALADTGFFPVTINTVTPGALTWLHQDKTDTWFVGLKDATTAFAWNSVTNELRTHVETWLNEVKLERDGRYLGLTGGGPGPFRYWDLQTDTFGPAQTIGSGAAKYYFSHNAGCRGMWISVNPDLIFAQDRMVVSGGQIVKTQISAVAASSGDEHNAGNWIQTDAQLPGGGLTKQWSYLSGGGTNVGWTPTVHHAIGVQRNDGTDTRILCHHYSTGDFTPYWDTPFALPSADGFIVLFNSNMAGSGRYDLFVAEVPLSTFVPDFYVSPTGGTGAGTISDPWSLIYAIGGAGGVIQPGHKIALRGGIYQLPDAQQTMPLSGTQANPIIFRAYPGERPNIRIGGQPTGSAFCSLRPTGSDIWWWGIEFSFNRWTTRTSAQAGSSPTDINAIAQYISFDFATRHRAIHCAFHDMGNGIGAGQAQNFEAYGCITYCNGWQGSDRAHGHGAYLQHQSTLGVRKYMLECVSFNNFDNCFQEFAQSDGLCSDITWQGCVAFGPGACATNPNGYLYTLSGVPQSGNIFDQCYSFVLGNVPGTQFGTDNSTGNGPLTITNCYLMGAIHWTGVDTGVNTFTGNTSVTAPTAGNPIWFLWEGLAGTSATAIASMAINNNQYFNTGVNSNNFVTFFSGAQNNYTFAGWQTILAASQGAEAASTYVAGAKTGTEIFVRPTTKYEANRGHVLIYNWDSLGSVNVDLSSIVAVGLPYKVYNLQSDPTLLSPVVTGTYAGGTVAFPTAAVQGPAAIGGPTPLSGSTKFNAYVVLGG